MIMKSMRLDEVFSREDIIKILDLMATNPVGGVAKVICKEIVEPRMTLINEITGQENDAMYIAYAVEYVVGEEVRKKLAERGSGYKLTPEDFFEH
jgi:hypothetical protein